MLKFMLSLETDNLQIHKMIRAVLCAKVWQTTRLL